MCVCVCVCVCVGGGGGHFWKAYCGNSLWFGSYYSDQKSERIIYLWNEVLCDVLRDWSLITGRGYTTGGGRGQVKLYPYKKRRGGGGRTSFSRGGGGGGEGRHNKNWGSFGVQKVSDPRFSYFVSPPPSP